MWRSSTCALGHSACLVLSDPSCSILACPVLSRRLNRLAGWLLKAPLSCQSSQKSALYNNQPSSSTPTRRSQCSGVFVSKVLVVVLVVLVVV